jgi:hypothetical protein
MPGPVGEVWGVRAQIGRESTPGVVVPATRILYLQEPVLQDEGENMFHDFATGTRAQTLEVTPTPKVVGGRVAAPVSSEELLELLNISVNGAPIISTPATGTLTRDHTFIPGDPASATLELDDGARSWAGLGVRGNTLNIAGNVREDNVASMDLFATDLVAQAMTVGPLGRNPGFFTGQETRIYIGAFGGDPTAFPAVPGLLINWDISLAFNLGRKYTADNTLAATSIPSGVIGAEATFTFEAIHAQGLTQFTNHRNATKLAIRLEFGNNQIIEGALKRTVWIDLPGAWVSKDLGGVDEQTRTYEFRYRYVRDNTMGYPYRIVCRTDRTAAF